MSNLTPEERRKVLAENSTWGTFGSDVGTITGPTALWNVLAGHADKDTELNRIKFGVNEGYRELALQLIEEEVAELREAVHNTDSYEIMDAIADILFTVFGLATKAGLAHMVVPALREVEMSNLTKIPEPGEALTVYPNGKIGKPAGYVPPDWDAVFRDWDEIRPQ